MKKKEREEILSRRDFFRKSISKTIPFLICATFPSYISSCGSDTPVGCSDCTGSCNGTCETTCSIGCANNSQSSQCSYCTDNCSNNCSSVCSSSCKNMSQTNVEEPEEEVSLATGIYDGYEYVDLGLSVKWARYNIGASKPESYGTYLYSHTLCYESDCFDKLVYGGFVGGVKSTSGTNYDMAISKWGKKWRMPTQDDFKELINNCTVSYIEYKGCNGYLFRSKKNGKSIFFAAAGYKWFHNGVWENCNVGSWGCYWSGDIQVPNAYVQDSFCLSCSHDSATGENNTRLYGWDMYAHQCTIRPVSNNGGTSSGCDGTCTAMCANNANGGCSGCSSNCSSGCVGGCNTGCKTTCSGNCPNGCHTLCGGGCNYSCGGTCKYVSAGTKCTGCARTCSSYCYRTCTMACSQSCMSCCITSSK